MRSSYLRRWFYDFDTTIGTEIHLWRFVRNIPGSQELKRVSRQPLEKKYCQGEEEALIGSFLFCSGQKITFSEY